MLFAWLASQTQPNKSESVPRVPFSAASPRSRLPSPTNTDKGFRIAGSGSQAIVIRCIFRDQRTATFTCGESTCTTRPPASQELGIPSGTRCSLPSRCLIPGRCSIPARATKRSVQTVKPRLGSASSCKCFGSRPAARTTTTAAAHRIRAADGCRCPVQTWNVLRLSCIDQAYFTLPALTGSRQGRRHKRLLAASNNQRPGTEVYGPEIAP